MSILKRILNGQARPAVMRPVPLVPQASKAEAVKTLELRVREALPPRPVPVEYESSPVQRAGLMAVGRVRQAEDSRVAQLEREVVMERLRVKELREKLGNLSAQLTVLQEAGYSDLVEDYEGLSPDDVIPWVERVLLPAYGQAVARLKGIGEPARAEPMWEKEVFFADEESEERFHRLRRGEILKGLVLIEGPPASGKTLLGRLLAGENSAQPLPSEKDLERMIADDVGNALFFDDIDTRHPWYCGAALQSAGTKLHSDAIIQALGKDYPLLLILAGQHIALSPEMQRLAICIRLKGGAL